MKSTCSFCGRNIDCNHTVFSCFFLAVERVFPEFIEDGLLENCIEYMVPSLQSLESRSPGVSSLFAVHLQAQVVLGTLVDLGIYKSAVNRSVCGGEFVGWKLFDITSISTEPCRDSRHV